MTYNVLMGTLNHTNSLTHSSPALKSSTLRLSLTTGHFSNVLLVLSCELAPNMLCMRKGSSSRRPVSISLSFCPSVTLLFCMQMAKDIINHDTHTQPCRLIILVLLAQAAHTVPRGPPPPSVVALNS